MTPAGEGILQDVDVRNNTGHVRMGWGIGELVTFDGGEIE